MDGLWISLFSGGKDSSWALYRALEAGYPVDRLVTVHPAGDSYLYHVPATQLAELAAESIGIDLVEIEPDDFEATAPRAESSTARGDRELAPLAAQLRSLAETHGGIDGIVAGAVESEYQTARIQRLCDRLEAELFAPLWQADPKSAATSMIDAGFEITIVRVAADGLDESWLGRTYDYRSLAELADLNDTHGVHVLGEGGEFETIVTDGPHMSRPIELDYETTYDGVRGRIRVTNARLG